VAFGFASAVNLAYSPLRHLAASTEKQRPLLAGLPQHHDILTGADRIYGVLEMQAGDDPGRPFEQFRNLADREFATSVNGEDLPYCETQGGLAAWFEVISDDLQAAGFTGRRIFVADLFGQLWMYGPFERVRGVAPWYYGGLPGIDNAEFVLVPLCPNYLRARAGVLQSLRDEGRALTEVHRGATYVLFTIDSSSS
jgi:hypothetical protein